MVSNHDLLRYAHELESGDSLGHSAKHKLTSVMNSRVLSATPTTEIREIAHLMLDEQVNAIPILDSAHHLVGILTTSDILRAIVHRDPLELWTEPTLNILNGYWYFMSQMISEVTPGFAPTRDHSPNAPPFEE